MLPHGAGCTRHAPTGDHLRCTAQTVDRTMTATATQTAAAHRPVPTIAARPARTWEGLWNSRLPGGVLPP
ncbi:hypothetical protein G6F63_016235 [Rhizopus arrhizus]|nr:hypothetical protein G6F24_018725 [Rhizopus arrhizus]KAG0906782.1 hypothetical protein G6F31_021748 [Rhizopus arrhizus]KAG1313091.1 hypothetical protein G6F63_016235 [Rhizopus arrhizus]